MGDLGFVFSPYAGEWQKYKSHGHGHMGVWVRMPFATQAIENKPKIPQIPHELALVLACIGLGTTTIDRWSDHVGLYIQQLEAHAMAERERQAGQAQQTELVTVEAAEAKLAPLAERLGRLLSSIPDSVQRKGIGIPELQRLLRGRQGRQAHQGEIAAALRSHGWTGKRSWKRNSPDGARSRWHPPGV